MSISFISFLVLFFLSRNLEHNFLLSLIMKWPSLKDAASLFRHISLNAEQYQRIIRISNTPLVHFIRYGDKDNNLEKICFKTNPNAKVQLSLKVNGRWESWLYVDKSTIKNAGRGVFAARIFEVDDPVGTFMGRKLSKEDLENKTHSEYALSNIDPCDHKGNQMHWYFFGHLMNHGNYTVANINVEPNLASFCTKRVLEDMEFLLDYKRPIFCKKCHEHRKVFGMKKRKRVKTKISVEGAIGKCRQCKSSKSKLVARECKKCGKKLCLDCYDKLQTSV